MKRIFYRIFVVVIEKYFASFTSNELNGRANSDNETFIRFQFDFFPFVLIPIP